MPTQNEKKKTGGRKKKTDASSVPPRTRPQKEVLHKSTAGYVGGKQKTNDLWHASVDKIRVASEKERLKINSSNHHFLTFLAQLFIGLMILSLMCMFFTWKILENYESKTPNGAMTAYVNLLKKENYDKIYDQSTVIFTQFNEKEPYIEYLKSVYEGVDLKKAVFSKKSYSDETFLFYDLLVDKERISTLELMFNEEKDSWNVRTVVESRNYYIEDFTGSDIYVNGILLDDNYKVNEEVPSDAYSNLYNINKAPLVTRYHLDGMVTVPSITTSDPDAAVVVDALVDRVYVGEKPTPAEEEVMTDMIRDTAMTYARYISEDATFAELDEYLYSKTDYYKAISGFVNRFFSTHDSYRFENMEITDLICYGEDKGFAGSISFDYIVTIDGVKSQTYTSTYQMTFLKLGGRWLCTNILIQS